MSEVRSSLRTLASNAPKVHLTAVLAALQPRFLAKATVAAAHQKAEMVAIASPEAALP